MPPSAHRKRTVLAIVRWFLLTVIGWLLYTLVRALGAFVYLGAPFFDWQWYLSIILLLVIASVYMVRGLPRPVSQFRWGCLLLRAQPPTGLGLAVLAALLIWTIAGYSGFGQTMYLYPARAPTVPISFWAGKGVVNVPEPVLEDLQSAGGSLYITAGAPAFEGERRRALVDGLRRLAEHDIDVYLAVVASDYLSVPVHEEWMDNVQKAAAFVENENLTNVRGIIGDAERPKYTPRDVYGVDRDAFFQAANNLNGLVRWKRSEYPDLSLGVTALWTLHLDAIDGDADLSIMDRSLVDPPGDWDFVNVMTYSSYVPPSWRPYYVYCVERTMARRYSDRPPSHLIGLAARGRPGEPTLDFADLVRDARLSRAMGVPEIVVFKLSDGVLEDSGFVRRLATAVNETDPDLAIEVPFSRPASMVIYSTLLVDALLDARGWKGLLWLGWAVLSGFIAYYAGRRAGRVGQ